MRTGINALLALAFTWSVEAQVVDTATRIGATRYLLMNNQVAAYTPTQRLPVSKIKTVFNKLPFTGALDAIVAVGNGTTYLFQGDRVAVFTLKKGKFKFSHDGALTDEFPGCPFAAIDAAFWHGWQHRLYLIRNSEAVRYVWATDPEDRVLVDAAPVALTTLLPNLPTPFDALFWKDNGTIDVLQGATFRVYHVRTQTVDPPRALSEVVTLPAQ